MLDLEAKVTKKIDTLVSTPQNRTLLPYANKIRLAKAEQLMPSRVK